MAAAHFPIPTADSTDPYALVLKGKQTLHRLDLQRKRLDRVIESVQRVRELRGHHAVVASVIPFPAGRQKTQPLSRTLCGSSATRSNLLYFPRI